MVISFKSKPRIQRTQYRIRRLVRSPEIEARLRSNPETIETLAVYNTGFKNMATVRVYYFNDDGRYFYEAEEPPVSEDEEKLYHLIFERIQSIDVEEVPEEPEKKEVFYEELVDRALEEMGYSHYISRSQILKYYLLRDRLGYGILDVVFKDDTIEDISLSRTGTVVIISTLDEIKANWIETNIELSKEERRQIIELLSFKIGKQINIAQPIVEGKTPEGYRIAMHIEEVSENSSFTARKHPKYVKSITRLVANKTISPLIAAYLWTLVENKRFVIFIGEMASGKTTMLQAVLSVVPRDQKIVTIEDARELRLEHPLWEPYYTRRSIYGTEKEITLIDLTWYALRSRAQYIVIGEVRGKEMRALVQAVATGHGAATTFHAENPHMLFLRMVSPPLSVEPSFLLLISAVVLQRRFYYTKTKQFIRRTDRIWEITGLDLDKHVPVKYDEVFRWVHETDSHEPNTIDELLKKSKKIQVIAQQKYGEEWEDKMYYELEEKVKFIEELVKNRVFDYTEVTKRIYYKNLELRRI